MKIIGILLIVASLTALLAVGAQAQQSTFGTTFCGGGTGTTSGVIPSNTILSGKTANENTLLLYAVLIMVVMFMITAMIYMIGSVLNLPVLLNYAKEEIGEVFVTALIILILVGGFTAAATGLTGFNPNGTGTVRQVYVDDCTYLTQASVSLIAPLLTLNLINLLSDTAASATITVKPDYFGIAFMPLVGFQLFDSVFALLSEAGFVLISVPFATLFFLAFIYGLFPLFLYAGIILRTVPWTRPAGGAFLGLFIGFYIIFPIMLHLLLANYANCLNNTGCSASSTITANPTTLTSLLTGADTSADKNGQSFFAYMLMFVQTFANFVMNGLIPTYIADVIEPAGFTMIAVVLSFIIAFDFTELAGDLLGAPSLTGGTVLNKLL